MDQVRTYFEKIHIPRGFIFGLILFTALVAFEIFNYITTDYALTDLLGDLRFLGVRWATVLAIAFCGIDFAGIARLFTPDSDSESSLTGHNETWYLFGAWLLAATMNAMLTWWGVSLAVLGHQTLGNEVVNRGTLLHIVPIFVAILIWLIRVLIIGTFSSAGDRLFSMTDQSHRSLSRVYAKTPTKPLPGNSMNAAAKSSEVSNTSIPSRHSVPKPSFSSQLDGSLSNRSDLAHRPLSMSSSVNRNEPHHLVTRSSIMKSRAKFDQ